ncbi:MAG TPA: hypothetical protein VL359_14245 [bacterium]|nr:hypothetical protein [bacterium]
MPITQERQTIQDLRAVGFSEEQSLLLAAKLEGTAQATAQDLKAFIQAEFQSLRQELDVRFAQMEARFERSLRILLVALISTFVGVTGLAVALIKLLP